jgi:hypothetical protein
MRSPHDVSHDEDHADTELSEAELAQVRGTCQTVRVSEIPHLSISSLEWDGLLLRLPASRMPCCRDFCPSDHVLLHRPRDKNHYPIGSVSRAWGLARDFPSCWSCRSAFIDFARTLAETDATNVLDLRSLYSNREVRASFDSPPMNFAMHSPVELSFFRGLNRSGVVFFFFCGHSYPYTVPYLDPPSATLLGSRLPLAI